MSVAVAASPVPRASLLPSVTRPRVRPPVLWGTHPCLGCPHPAAVQIFLSLFDMVMLTVKKEKRKKTVISCVFGLFRERFPVACQTPP